MKREDIIRMAREAGFAGGGCEALFRFAALVAAAERDRLEPEFERLEILMKIREGQPNKPCCFAERERIIKFLQEMQRSVGDAHNHYGVAAVRIKEGI